MVPPVFLPEWPDAEGEEATHFTSVLQWRSYAEVVHDGVRYGNKDLEFQKFLELPKRTDQPFRMALTGTAPETLADQGWEVVPGWIASRTAASYRDFVSTSRAEFGVAKQGYVARTVCYLASGRPALVQDTGLAGCLPLGRGLLVFDDLDGAVRGVETINADYELQRRAARSLAEEYASTRRVLPPFLERALA
jgi:hypothetical protein